MIIKSFQSHLSMRMINVSKISQNMAKSSADTIQVKWTFVLLLLIAVIRAAEMKTIKASTTEELQAAIKTAQAGDKIELLPIEYNGNFILPSGNAQVTIYGTSNNGTPPKSTTIVPPAGNENSTAFEINGDNWAVESLSIRGFETAAILKGNSNSLTSIVLEKCQNGFKVLGNMSTIKSCVINGAGKGFGIDLKGNNGSILSTVIQSVDDGLTISGQGFSLRSTVVTAKKTVNILPEVLSGEFISNVLNGPATVSGSGITFTSNTGNGGMTINGSANRFRANVFNQVNITTDGNFDEGGNLFSYTRGSKKIGNSQFGFL